MTVTLASPTQLVPASARVSVLVGDNRQIDLVLPSAVPLLTLVDGTVTAVNRILRARGDEELPPGCYEFARAEGYSALDMRVSLSGQGVRDRDLLVLLPAGKAERYTPVVENVSTALARQAEQHYPAVSARDALACGAALLGVALTVIAGLLWRMRWGTDSGWIIGGVFAGLTAAALGAVYVCRRVAAPAWMTAGAWWVSLAAATLAGAAIPPGAHPGSPHLLLASAIALVGVVQVARATGARLVPCAIVTVTFSALVAASCRMFLNIPGQRIAIVALVAVLIASRIAPTIGLLLAKVPRQHFGRITGEQIFASLPDSDAVVPATPGADDVTPTGEQIAALAHKSNRVLSGVLLGVAVVQVAASIFTINPRGPSQWQFIAISAVVSLALILRARAFRHRVHALLTVAGAVLALYTLPAHYGFSAATAALRPGFLAAGVILAIATTGLALGMVIPTRYFAPTIRVVVEFMEYVLLALVVPLAFWAVGLVHFVRYR